MSWNKSHKAALETPDTTLDIFEFLLEHDGARISDITKELDLATTTVYNHLETLRSHGLAVREANSYFIGIRCQQFGQYARRRRWFYQLIKNHTADLAANIEGDVDFSIEEHGRVFPIYRETKYQYSNSFEGRYVFYMHNSAVGKAILAEYSGERVEKIIQQWGLPSETPNSIESKDALCNQLEAVREQGYAINDEENNEGLRAIAAPVIGLLDQVVGAISISGPSYWLADSKINRLSDRLLERTTKLESAMASEFP